MSLLCSVHQLSVSSGKITVSNSTSSQMVHWLAIANLKVLSLKPWHSFSLVSLSMYSHLAVKEVLKLTLATEKANPPQ